MVQRVFVDLSPSLSLSRSLFLAFLTFALFRRTPVASSSLRNLVIGGAVGVLSIAAINIVSDNVSNTSAASDSFADPVQRRLRGCYGYVAASLAGTAVAAGAIFRSGLAYRLMAMNPMVVGIGSMIGIIGALSFPLTFNQWQQYAQFLMVSIIGTMMLTRSIDYHTSPVAKHLALASFVGMQALMMAPLAALGGPLLLRAAVATAAIVGAVSLTAATAPSQAYLSMGAPLSIGFGLIFASSLGSMFFPGIPLLYNIVLYGGLALHGGMLFYRTQGIIDGATHHPQARFDPINDSLGIYIDSIAIFWRLAMIMQGGGGSRKRN